MIKKLISLALASVSTLALAGCGATDNPVMDQSLMGDGMGNKTGLGGYWWAYGDRTDTSSVVPDTGKTNPLDTSERPPKLKPSIGVNNGIDAGAYHVKGYVGVAPLYSRTDVYDTYWDNFYGPNGTDAPGVCGAPTDVKASACKEMKYPSVGMGFGFKASNVPLGDDAKDMVGVTFKMKLGPSHAATCVDPTSTTGAAMACPVEVSLPMDLTDVPDPSYGDQFGTLYANYAPTGKPTKAGVNTPICTFPGTVITNPDGSLGEQGSTTKTCFANLSTFGQFTADGKGVLAPVDATKFTTFCLSWSVFGPPSWAISGLNAAKPVSVTKMADLKDHITKMQFEAFKPLETATAPVDFDFFVDDVYLLDQAKWDEICVKGGATIPVLL